MSDYFPLGSQGSFSAILLTENIDSGKGKCRPDQEPTLTVLVFDAGCTSGAAAGSTRTRSVRTSPPLCVSLSEKETTFAAVPEAAADPRYISHNLHHCEVNYAQTTLDVSR